VTTATWLMLACACGAQESSPSVPITPERTVSDQPPVVVASAREVTLPGVRCAVGEAPTARWRFALIAGSFEATRSIHRDELVAAWQAGTIAASEDTARALAGMLGPRGSGPVLAERTREPVANGWAIVSAHELSPAWSVIEVDDKHPLLDDGVLAVPVCGAGNIDRQKLTTLVMSGTTALTGRTAKRVDDTGVLDTVKHIAPFFRSADLVHVSNEVAFVRDCKPSTGQEKPKLKFCARDRYVELLEALNTKLVELTGSHLTDYGQRAMARTIKMYEKRGWVWFGGGRTQIEASEPRFVEHNGNRLAFVGCNAVNWWVKAISAGLGTANCDWARMKWQIQELRREGYLPIATVQHRELRTHTPAPDLVRDLRGLAEAGAMFVLGSQAHVAHPWDVHHGAYVHYGPGNILFAQYREGQREATVDKLYIHDGKLLTVGHIFTRTEKGRPRLLSEDERGELLADLAASAASIAPAEPWATPALPPITRERPDSFVVDGKSQRLEVTQPAQIVAGKRYPLIVDLDGSQTATDDAFYVTRVGDFVIKQSKLRRGKIAGTATAKDIVAYLRTKYPIDKRAVTITADPEHPEKRRRSKRHRSRSTSVTRD
jgi:hypothetical protein